MQRFLNTVERVGNMVPHPVVIFLILIGGLIIISVIASLFGASATIERINPSTNEIERTTTAVRSLLTADDIRFLNESMIPNFMSFDAAGLLIGAVMGAGVMEESGFVKTLIRKLALVSPARLLSYILAFVGVLASIADDAGYLVLLPLAGVAFASVGRHPMCTERNIDSVSGMEQPRIEPRNRSKWSDRLGPVQSTNMKLELVKHGVTEGVTENE
jgi:aminobenzoyl-glutamate transport protein